MFVYYLDELLKYIMHSCEECDLEWEDVISCIFLVSHLVRMCGEQNRPQYYQPLVSGLCDVFSQTQENIKATLGGWVSYSTIFCREAIPPFQCSMNAGFYLYCLKVSGTISENH